MLGSRPLLEAAVVDSVAAVSRGSAGIDAGVLLPCRAQQADCPELQADGDRAAPHRVMSPVLLLETPAAMLRINWMIRVHAIVDSRQITCADTKK